MPTPPLPPSSCTCWGEDDPTQKSHCPGSVHRFPEGWREQLCPTRPPMALLGPPLQHWPTTTDAHPDRVQTKSRSHQIPKMTTSRHQLPPPAEPAVPPRRPPAHPRSSPLKGATQPHSTPGGHPPSDAGTWENRLSTKSRGAQTKSTTNMSNKWAYKKHYKKSHKVSRRRKKDPTKSPLSTPRARTHFGHKSNTTIFL